jgi:hypothetical protein
LKNKIKKIPLLLETKFGFSMDCSTREEFYEFIKTENDSDENISKDTLYYLKVFDLYQQTGNAVHPNFFPCYGKINDFTIYYIIAKIDLCMAIFFLFTGSLILFAYIPMRILYSDYFFLKYTLSMIENGHKRDTGTYKKTINFPTILFLFILLFNSSLALSIFHLSIHHLVQLMHK